MQVVASALTVVLLQQILERPVHLNTYSCPVPGLALYLDFVTPKEEKVRTLPVLDCSGGCLL